MLNAEYIEIHYALHGDSKSVNINGLILPIKVWRNGCRYVDYFVNGKSVRLIQQSKDKDSIYSRKAKMGHKITWVIQEIDPWILIDEDEIIKYKQLKQTIFKNINSGSLHRTMS